MQENRNRFLTPNLDNNHLISIITELQCMQNSTGNAFAFYRKRTTSTSIQICKRTDKLRPKPNPKPKNDLKSKPGPKWPET